MQLGDLGSAVSEFSHLLSQSITLPFGRRRHPANGRERRVAPTVGVSRTMAVQVRGTLLVAEGPVDDAVIVELMHRAGGRHAKAVVLPVTRHDLPGVGERYRRYLARFGMDLPETVPLTTREQAASPVHAAKVGGADLIVIGGGNPGDLLDILAQTAVGAALQAAFVRGAVVTLLGPVIEAAGEWALGVAPEDPGAGPLRKGLGLVPGTLICSGARCGGRLAQVCGATMAAGVQGLVLDARAALLLHGTWQGEVLTGTVLALGNRGSSEEREPGEVAARVVPAGWRLDLAAGLLLPPGPPTSPSMPDRQR